MKTGSIDGEILRVRERRIVEAMRLPALERYEVAFQFEAKTPKELLVEVKEPRAGVKTLTVTANTEAFDTEIVTRKGRRGAEI